jgi:hypothetical protein
VYSYGIGIYQKTDGITDFNLVFKDMFIGGKKSNNVTRSNSEMSYQSQMEKI